MRPQRPTRRQKQIIDSLRLTVSNYLVVSETDTVITLYNKSTGKNHNTIQKGEENMKYIVNLRIETHSEVAVELYSVTARNPKAAKFAAAMKANRKYGEDNIIEIVVISVTEVSHAVA